MTEELLEYIGNLQTDQGWNQGNKFVVFPWEKRFLTGTFGQEYLQGDSALTCARGAGKTSFIATIAASAINGPLVQDRAETIVVAPSLGQARLTFSHVRWMLREELDNRRCWKVWDNGQTSLIENRQTGQVLKCVGADPRRLHGLSPALTIIDEGAQFSPNTAEETYAVLRSAHGKIPGSRMIAIGTRPPEGVDHFFNSMLEESDYVQIHACTKDIDPPFQRKSWEKACPSLRHGMPSLLAEIEAEARRAKKNPGLLPAFRSLRCNMGTTAVTRNHVIDPDTWRAAESETAGREGPLVIAMDLSDGTSQCAASGYWRSTGNLEALAAFPEKPSLAERGLKDGVGKLYARCAQRGELFTTPGRAVDVGLLLRRVLQTWGRPVAICADRYRENDLRAALDAVKFPQASLVLRGQGFKDGAEDVRGFRRAMAEDEVHPVPSLLLRSAFAEAVTVSDPAANEKLAKGSEGGRRMRARDDSCASTILAVAEAYRRWPDRPTDAQPRRLYLGKV